MPYEPPWLNVNPSGLAEAAARGGQMRLEGQRIAEEAASSAAQRNVELTRIETERQIQQQKQDLATQLAARKFAAQQQYAQLVQQGMDPIDAMLHVGPAMAGGTETGIGQLATAQARLHMLNQTPVPVTDENGKVIGYQGGNVRFIPREAQPKINPADYTKIEEKTPGEKGLNAVPASPASGGPSLWGLNPFHTDATAAQPAIPGIPATTVTRMVPNQPQGGGKQPSQKAIDYLIAHPDVASQFDAKYGQGTAEQYLQQ